VLADAKDNRIRCEDAVTKALQSGEPHELRRAFADMERANALVRALTPTT
jgi:hypothetical protein